MSEVYKLGVKWSDDLFLDDLHTFCNYCDKYESLYTILERIIRYGEPEYSLLYIGMTYSQSIANRLSNHHKLRDIRNYETRRKKIIIRAGRIILPSGNRISKKLVRDVEAILINNHKPPHNESSTYAYRGGRDLRIINQGNYKPLNRIIDTSNWEYI